MLIEHFEELDVRFSLTFVFLDIFYIFFSLPISIIVLLPNFFLSLFYIFFTYIAFLRYSINFYLIFSVNSLFKEEFFSFFKFCSNKNNTANNNQINVATRENIALNTEMGNH